tara:strand:- start:133 stop:1254 length:1122 start_codon:yes stop_codon:yes gene_type:complete
MKVPKIHFDKPEEEPETVTTGEMVAHVNTVVAHIKSMSGFTDFRAQTIVLWCIATYGFEKVRKFPILVVMGVHRSGKTTALEFIQTLANPPIIEEDNADIEKRRTAMMQVGTITASVTGQLFMRGGTHCLDEADPWDEDYLTKVFDKKSGAISKNERLKNGNYKYVVVATDTALVMNRRTHFHDPANKDRCIILRTTKKASGALDTEPNMSLLAPYAEHLQYISDTLCDWESIPESGVSRPEEKWRILIHVAEKLGFDKYIKNAKLEIERELKDTDTSEEEGTAVFRHIVANTVKFERVDEWVTTKSIRMGLYEEGKNTSAHAINSHAKDMGFKQGYRGGQSRIYIPSAPDKRLDKLIEIAELIGYEDELLKH